MLDRVRGIDTMDEGAQRSAPCVPSGCKISE